MNHRQRLVRNRLTLIWVALCLIALAIAFSVGSAKPTVYLTMEGECVRVIAADGTEQDCSVIRFNRDKYHVVRVASNKDATVMSERPIVVPTGKDAEEIARR